MSLNIAEFVKKLVPSLSRSDAEADLSISLEAIQVILTTCQGVSEIEKVSKFSSKKAQEAVKEFYSEFGKTGNTKIRMTKKFGDDLGALFVNVLKNGDYFQKELEDITNEIIVTHALKIVKVNVIRAVAHYDFMTRFALDLINYIYLFEAEHGGIEFTSEGQLKKTQIDFIEKNLWIFARLVSFYGENPEDLRDRMEKLTDTVIPKDSVDEVLEVYDANQLDALSSLPSGFVGSPIYSVRLVFAQWEADRYRHLKDKKRLLELRLLHLRMLKENGQADIQMEKEMTSLQKSVTSIDYNLSKIESDLND